MKNRQSISCDPRLLQLSLEESLSEHDEELLAAHLSDCESCRRSLEQLAAGEPDWQRIGEALRDELQSTNDKRQGSAGFAAIEETILYERRANYATSPLDFAVDFLEPPTREQSLGRLGEIDILQVIGHGGMGIVLKGFQSALNRPVAVKVLAPHLATSGAARQRFGREAQAAAAVVHPNVMPIFTVDGSGKLPYLVMPYINGESLQERIDRRGALEVLDVLRIGLQVARGLAAAHAQGLVHRDIKPANILLERGVDRVLLTDFGLARAADDASLTRTGFIAGTPLYMSPEQARGDSIDARSDLFSLGSVLYTMCTGRPPFRAESSYGILRRITDNDPRPITDSHASVPNWLVALVDRLLAKRADQRFQSAEKVAEIMEKCLAHVQQPGQVSIPAELGARTRARRLPVMTSMAVAAVLFGSSVAYWKLQPLATTDTIDNSDATDQNNVTRSVPSADTLPIHRDNQVQTAPNNARWDDDVPNQIEQLRNEIQNLQQRVDSGW
jgi:serine/threonine-protein kinase